MNVMWFSAGVSSAIAAHIARQELDEVIYFHIDDQHPDTMRFVQDVGKLLIRPITVMQHPIWKSVEAVCLHHNFVNSPRGAKCTEKLKKELRKMWEYEHEGRHTYFWGFDADEEKRAETLVDHMPDFDHRFPLIERKMSKADAHGMLKELGVRRPAMYDLGYHNNNCIGCLKGGKGYWNKIREDFPAVFVRRSQLEREIGCTCLKGIYLDELDPEAGRHDPPITQECGVACMLTEGYLDRNGIYDPLTSQSPSAGQPSVQPGKP